MLTCGFCSAGIKAPDDVDEEDNGENLPAEIKQVRRNGGIQAVNSVRTSEAEERDMTVHAETQQLIN